VAESIEEKAERLLVDGRIRLVRVEPNSGLVVAKAEGDTGTWDLGYDPKGREWRCNCPARVRPCSHLLAVQLVAGDR
jgi:hypothetical protein